MPHAANYLLLYKILRTRVGGCMQNYLYISCSDILRKRHCFADAERTCGLR